MKCIRAHKEHHQEPHYVHGNTEYFRCAKCGREHSRPWRFSPDAAIGGRRFAWWLYNAAFRLFGQTRVWPWMGRAIWN